MLAPPSLHQLLSGLNVGDAYTTAGAASAYVAGETTAAAGVINTSTDNVAGAATALDGPNVALSRHHLFQTGTAGSGLVTAASEDLLDTANEISAFSIEELTGFIQNAATARAENGAQAQRRTGPPRCSARTTPTSKLLTAVCGT